MGWEHPRRALNGKSLRTAVSRALDGQTRGSGAGRERRGRGGKDSEEPLRSAVLRGPQAQGLGLGPGRTAGGRRGVAAGRAAVRSLAAPRTAAGFGPAWPPPSSRAGRTAGLRPPRHPPSEPLPDSDAGRSGALGLSRHGGSIIHGAPGRAPKTCSAPGFSRGVGRRQGKSSQSKVGHISHFPNYFAGCEGLNHQQDAVLALVMQTGRGRSKKGQVTCR
ncbi:uncharacterized protein LOC123645129 isoform X2 [Lemur catta]|uniref:uncharacterized protein LOC123645129 isoform X2 n=1 Tax=Lemur catta TaxID=9447 RepID=UPI001E26B098|nr:uncharacterized protein LOC123645129 isoform X2 [Lemur catta]